VTALLPEKYKETKKQERGTKRDLSSHIALFFPLSSYYSKLSLKDLFYHLGFITAHDSISLVRDG